MKNILYILVVLAFCSSVALATEIPILNCVWNNIGGEFYYNLAAWSTYWTDSSLNSYYRIGIWEPDPAHGCQWKIGYTINNHGSPEELNVNFAFNNEWAAWMNEDRYKGIHFEKDYLDYFEGYGQDSAAQIIQVDLYDQDSAPSWWFDFDGNQVIWGSTSWRIYDAHPIFRIDRATVQVHSDSDDTFDPPYYEGTFRHDANDVLRHEIGHALLFGDDNSYFDGMFNESARTRNVSDSEKLMVQCAYSYEFYEACDLNVAAKVSDFWVSDQFRATWTAVNEANVGCYKIQGYDGANWIDLVVGVAAGVGSYDVPVSGAGIEKFRLIEEGGGSGSLVKNLVNQDLGRGTHVIEWDGHNGSGARVSSGVYFVRMNSGDYSANRKILLVK